MPMSFTDLLHAIDEREKALTHAHERMASSISELQALDHAIDEIPTLHDSFDTEDLLAAAKQYHDGLDELHQAQTHAGEELGQEGDESVKAIAELHSTSDEDWKKLEQAHQELDQSAEAEQHNRAELATALKQRQGEIQSEFDALQSHIEGLVHSLEQLSQKTQQQLHEFASSTSGQSTQAVDQGSHDFDAVLDAITGSLLPKAIESLSDVVEVGFEGLVDGVTNLAETLETRATDILNDLLDHVEHAVTDALEKLFDHLVEEVVQEMVKTMAECIITMELGVSITAAISEFLPVLMLVKEILHWINELFSLF